MVVAACLTVLSLSSCSSYWFFPKHLWAIFGFMWSEFIICLCSMKVQCNLCENFLSSQTSLRTHQRVHTGEKPFQCEICRKSFSQDINLRTHSLSHKDEKGHKCIQCHQIFAGLNFLKQHMKTHNFTMKNHSCEMCGKKFASLENLSKHSGIHNTTRYQNIMENNCVNPNGTLL